MKEVIILNIQVKNYPVTGDPDGKSNEPYTLLPAVLDDMIQYIEQVEEEIEGEWGTGRSLQQLKDAKEMPDIYYKLMALKNGG